VYQRFYCAGEYESVAVANVVRPAIEGVVLSWAAPNQPGYGHVNARVPGYVQATMERHGLKLDAETTMKLRQAAALDWFRNHTLVYRVSSHHA